MTPETANTNAVPQRADMEDKYTWRLSDIFADDMAWEKAFTQTRDRLEEASQYTGKLESSPETLYNCLKLRSDLSMQIFNLYQYAYLNKDMDNRVSRYQEMTERAATLSAQAGAAFSFVEPELLQIDEDKLKEMAAQFPKTDEFDFYISELIRSRAHIRSAEVEEVLANSAIVARGPSSIFTMLDDADMTYGEIEDPDGNMVTLTKPRYYKIMESRDRDFRKRANVAFYTPYKAHVNTIGASLNASVQSDVFYARMRKFESCLHNALDSDNIPLSVYHSLLNSTEQNIKGLHDYVTLRKDLLGIDAVYSYDMICPLFPDEDYEVPYDDAVEHVIAACEPLGEKYGKQLRHAFGDRWIDVFETQGKGSGAYSFGNYSVHPFVLMNYNDTVDNMFTLAHELGHAMHSWLTSQTQPYPKSRYSIFVAEVASTINEGLLLNLLLERAENKGQKLYLLNRYIDNTTGTFFRQIMYARFELMIHEAVEKGGALSPDAMNEMWGQLTEQYFGPDFKLDEFEAFKWSRIPHFYNAYYVYQYATSYAASQAILKKFEEGEEGIVEKYLDLLKAGGKDHPIELLKAVGVDMTTAQPVEATIDAYADQVAEMRKLAT